MAILVGRNVLDPQKLREGAGGSLDAFEARLRSTQSADFERQRWARTSSEWQEQFMALLGPAASNPSPLANHCKSS